MSAALEFPTERFIDTALDISKRRKDKLLRVKQAIRNRDLDEADRLITELIPDDETGAGTHPRKYGIASRKR